MSTADEMLKVAQARTQLLAAPGLSARPLRRVAILTCMDARIDVFPMLGLKRGDAHIIRNAGGLVTDDALRSLSISQHMLGTEEVIVIMHDGCGLHRASEASFVEMLGVDGASPPWRMGTFDDTEEALREGLKALRTSPYLRVSTAIRGFVFDPDGGTLREVDAAGGAGPRA